MNTRAESNIFSLHRKKKSATLPEMKTSKIKRVAVEAALEAGRLLKKSLGRRRVIRYKSKGVRDLVTEMDTRAQALIIRRIKSVFPSHNILAEENVNTKESSGVRWFIDPLDGTTNYAHGFPWFGVSIGVEEDGELVCGVVYNPNLDELFVAEKGKGATCNGKRIHVSGTGKLKDALLTTGFPYDIEENPNNNLNYFAAFSLSSQAVRRPGSASLDLCSVACGRFDGFWEMKLSPWDMAAGMVIVKEAGGNVTDFSGGNLNLYKKELVSSNGKIHKQMLDVLKKTKPVSLASLKLSP